MSQPYSGAVNIHALGAAYIIEFNQASVINQRTVDGFQSDIDRLIARGPAPKIIISFAGVRNVTSSILGVLISAHQQCVAGGGELRLAAVNKSILGVLKLMRIDKILKVYPTTEKALEHF